MLQGRSLRVGSGQQVQGRVLSETLTRGLMPEKARLDQLHGHEGGRGKSKDLVGAAQLGELPELWDIQ